MGKSFVPSLLLFSAFDRPDGDDDHDSDDGGDDVYRYCEWLKIPIHPETGCKEWKGEVSADKALQQFKVLKHLWQSKTNTLQASEPIK